ncbi:hypothetical protein BDD43_2359 [Mucilaginibacter gracilis]|uniref:Uncharacterized protein n=1 Tax=Mucilaginibacter gracilis TaxID=423350 RepID=A0A495J1I8_9SPHI|nr:hypothetical protein [Mucilaginibacter gracilis]RKR82188.1 hypothetical protein BDD43_2359 [Mucilaginibacter gracilis]
MQLKHCLITIISVFLYISVSAQDKNHLAFRKISEREQMDYHVADSLLLKLHQYKSSESSSQYWKITNLLAERQKTYDNLYNQLFDNWEQNYISDYMIEKIKSAMYDIEDCVRRANIALDQAPAAEDAELRKENPQKYKEKKQSDGLSKFTTSLFTMGSSGSTDFKSIGLNVVLSLPAQSVPIYSDVVQTYSDPQYKTSSYSNSSTSFGYVGAKLDLEFHILNNDFIDLQLLGSGTYSNTGLFTSSLGSINETDEYYDYGYGASLAFGLPALKLYGEYMGGYRNVNYVSDISTSYGSGTTDITSTSFSGYTFNRFTGGLKISFDTDEGESFVKLKYAIEKPDIKSTNNNIWGVGLGFRYFVDISAMYFPEYPVSGTPSYRINNNDKQSFVTVTIGRAFNLFGGK